MTTQFENVPVKDFLSQIKKLGDYTISAQADGLVFYFGIDSDGIFYTSPYSPSKRTKFSYKVSDYKLEVENNHYRSAHAVLSKKQEEIKKILDKGEAVECQLVTKAPTEFQSSADTIYIVRGVIGEINSPKHNILDDLISALHGSLQAKLKILTSTNGEDLQTQDQLCMWRVRKAKSTSGNKITSSKFNSILSKMESFLEKENDKANDLGLNFSNYDVLTINLIQVKADKRGEIKREREKLNDVILKKYKLPIKQELIVNLENELGAKAGVLHKGSNSFFISSDEFAAAARFDTIAKREVSGIQRSSDKNASIEERGGLKGIADQRIAELLGVPELAKPQSSKKVFKQLRGSNPRQTAQAFAEQLSQLDFQGVKTKIGAILKYTNSEISKKLDQFKQDATSFSMTTGEGDKVSLSPDSIKQNLLHFAQTIKEIKDQIEEVKRSKSFTDLVLALYGTDIYSLHGKHISEAIILEANNPSISYISHLSGEDICHAYTATILASTLLLRVKDRMAVSLIKDNFTSLSKFNSNSSPLNYWGALAFSPIYTEAKKHLSSHTIKELVRTSGRMNMIRVNRFHHMMSRAAFVQDWEYIEETTNIIAMRLETRGQVINMAIKGIRNWDDITLSDKNTIIAKVFYYLQAHASNSPLLARIRNLAVETLKAANRENQSEKTPVSDMKENLFKKLSSLIEDEMSASTANNAVTAVGNAAFADMGTSLDASNTGANVGRKLKTSPKPFLPQSQTKFMNGKPIIRKKRDFVKKGKFQRFPEENIKEEDGTVASAVGGAAPGVTSSSDIATYPQRLFDKKGKKKKMIKRIFPLPAKLKASDFFSEMTESLYKIQLSWNDEEFTGNPQNDEGFVTLKSQYGISPKLVESKGLDGWPIVELVGYRDKLEKFLLEVYGAEQDFISSNIKLVFGE